MGGALVEIRAWLRCGFALLALALLALALPGWGQTNTGAVAGHVSDPSGRAVAGAVITIQNTDLAAVRTAVADSHGDFRVGGLVPGALTVSAKGQGMATRRPVRVTLGLGSTVRVALTLSVASVAQKATVTAAGRTAEGNTLAPPVNKDEAAVSSFFAGQTVTYLPSRGRDFTQLGQLGAGETDDGGGGLVVAGQRATAVIMQVDGVSFNDPLHGGRRGAGDGTFFLPQTVVREFQMVRSGVTAEVGGTGAGLINVPTKEGSNRGRGEAFVTTRPGWATSADAFGHRMDNRQNTFGASYGGPVRRDRMFYYAGFEQDFLRAPYFVEFEPQGPGVGVPAGLGGLQGEVPQREAPGALLVRGDAVLNRGNTLNVLAALNRVRGANVGDGSTRGIAGMEHASALSGQSVWSKASVATLVKEAGVNQLGVSWASDHRNRMPNAVTAERVINGFGVLGGDSLGEQLSTSGQMQVGDTLSISRGRAAFDGGGGFAFSPFYEMQEANRNGRFDYNSLGDFLAGSPRRYQQTFAVGDTRFRGSVRGGEVFGDARLPVGSKVTVTAGLRWEGQWNPQPARPNPAVAQTLRVPADLSQWQPRLGVAWTPAVRTTVKVSAGVYDAATPATLFHRVAIDNGLQTIVADSYFDPQVLALAAGGALNGPPVGLRYPAALVVGIDPGFRNPRSLQAAATVEQEIRPQLKVSAGYLHDGTWRLQRRLDENLAPPVLVAGLPVFNAARPNATMGRLMVNQSTAHSSYDGLLISSVYQMGPRSQMTVNYTLSQTHDDDSTAGPYDRDAALSPFNLGLERGFSTQDVRHGLNVSGIFNLPMGFKCNPIFLAHSGRPYTPIIGFDTQHDANDGNDRALVGAGTAGRNSLRQPGFTDVDVRLVKDFTLKGVGHHLDLFLDVFNVGGAGNRGFGGDAVSVYGSAGSPVASAGQALFAPDGTRAGDAREIQFTARLVGF